MTNFGINTNEICVDGCNFVYSESKYFMIEFRISNNDDIHYFWNNYGGMLLVKTQGAHISLNFNLYTS